MYRFIGTEEEVKEKLLDMVQEDREKDEVNWEYGTESVDDVQDGGCLEFYACGCYSDYHIDYSAVLFVHLEQV